LWNSTRFVRKRSDFWVFLLCGDFFIVGLLPSSAHSTFFFFLHSARLSSLRCHCLIHCLSHCCIYCIVVIIIVALLPHSLTHSFIHCPGSWVWREERIEGGTATLSLDWHQAITSGLFWKVFSCLISETIPPFCIRWGFYQEWYVMMKVTSQCQMLFYGVYNIMCVYNITVTCRSAWSFCWNMRLIFKIVSSWKSHYPPQSRCLSSLLAFCYHGLFLQVLLLQKLLSTRVGVIFWAMVWLQFWYSVLLR
jgi:hypothetical protein